MSAIIIFKVNGHHIYYTGGSIQDHESSKYYCNYLLFNKAIENAFNQRAKIFDFGTSPKNHHSLIEFKKNGNLLLTLISHCLSVIIILTQLLEKAFFLPWWHIP